MDTIKVVNKKVYQGPGEYIGRPSPLGNPFTIGRDGDRTTVIEKYRKWLWGKMQGNTDQMAELRRMVAKLNLEGKLVLICWCKPEACHGDIIKRAVEYLNK